jgi:site-specific recombinase XerD
MKRMPPPDAETPVRSKMAVDRLIARREVHVREKTLWRMLYETVARAEEILGVTSRSWTSPPEGVWVKAKGAQPRTRRCGARARTTYWSPCTGTPAPPGCCPS